MWKHLWTHVDNIVFEFDDHLQPSAKLPEFVSFVHHTLMQCTRPNLKKFSLCIFGVKFDHELLDEWLQCVFKKKLEFLKLDLIVDDYCYPEWFYHNPSLVKMEINVNNSWWYDGHTVSWTSLTSLQLSFVQISDEQITILLSGCPVLETLVLIETLIISSLNIKSPSLKTLKIVNMEENGSRKWFDIDAPYLKELEIIKTNQTWLSVPRFQFRNVSSLVYANLDYTPKSFEDDINIAWPGVAAKLLKSVKHVVGYLSASKD
ncbi:hypothetical protein DH2020_012630 [Rehmannia glutinosa]|uniref:F-box/LRR-repeat protein 15/At3g58940/PEG3-like LRR domain-containing protein n=1 Tax=Rehmannia glutinosa TaxID=99300 RepID=A0ABR0X0B4_REHGL